MNIISPVSLFPNRNSPQNANKNTNNFIKLSGNSKIKPDAVDLKNSQNNEVKANSEISNNNENYFKRHKKILTALTGLFALAGGIFATYKCGGFNKLKGYLIKHDMQSIKDMSIEANKELNKIQEKSKEVLEDIKRETDEIIEIIENNIEKVKSSQKIIDKENGTTIIQFKKMEGNNSTIADYIIEEFREGKIKRRALFNIKKDTSETYKPSILKVYDYLEGDKKNILSISENEKNDNVLISKVFNYHKKENGVSTQESSWLFAGKNIENLNLISCMKEIVTKENSMEIDRSYKFYPYRNKTSKQLARGVIKDKNGNKTTQEIFRFDKDNNLNAYTKNTSENNAECKIDLQYKFSKNKDSANYNIVIKNDDKKSQEEFTFINGKISKHNKNASKKN